MLEGAVLSEGNSEFQLHRFKLLDIMKNITDGHHISNMSFNKSFSSTIDADWFNYATAMMLLTHLRKSVVSKSVIQSTSAVHIDRLFTICSLGLRFNFVVVCPQRFCLGLLLNSVGLWIVSGWHHAHATFLRLCALLITKKASVFVLVWVLHLGKVKKLMWASNLRLLSFLIL